MIKSQICNLRDKTKSDLYALGEADDDFGGYFVINGIERVVRMQIKMVYDTFGINVIKCKCEFSETEFSNCIGK